MIPLAIKAFNLKEEPPACFKDCEAGGECSYPKCGRGAVREAQHNDPPGLKGFVSSPFYAGWIRQNAVEAKA